jgi:hypothetical protein
MKSCNSYENLLARPNLAEEIDTELASRQLREFARQAWPVVEPATAFVSNWHLDAICEHLQAVTLGQIRRLLICMPPRHMKSLLVLTCINRSNVAWEPTGGPQLWSIRRERLPAGMPSQSGRWLREADELPYN